MDIQQQAAREFRESAIAGTEDESAAWWTGALSRPVPGLPDLPAGPTPEDVQQMTNQEWAAARQNLGIGNGSDFPGTSSWSDRAQARAAALHAATTRPVTDLDKYTQERTALGVKDVGDVVGDPRGNLRRHKSPWQL